MGQAAVIRTGGLLWGALGVLAFSVSLPATRVAVLGGLDPLFVGAGRAALAGCLALLALRLGGQGRPPRRMIGRLLMVVLGVVIGFPFLTTLALARVPAVHGVVLTGLLPAATAVAAVLRAGERPSPRFWLSAGAGLLAVLAFAWSQGAGTVDAADLLLLAAVALCGLGYAEGAVLSRELGGIQAISLALAFALPLTVPVTLWRADPAMLAAVTPAAWAGFAYVSLFSAYLGFFAWYRGLAVGGVARVGQLQLAQPVLSLAWAALLLGEPLTAATVAAAAAVLACVVLTQSAR